MPFPTKLFHKYPNLKQIGISTHLETNSAENLKQATELEDLDLATNNNLKTIDDYAFNEAPNLKKLTLTTNRLTKIPKTLLLGYRHCLNCI